jgi:hypothetical protein
MERDLRVSTLAEMTCIANAVPCEFCREAVALSASNLCGPCFVDFQAAELEGVELKREDFEVDQVLGVRR